MTGFLKNGRIQQLFKLSSIVALLLCIPLRCYGEEKKTRIFVVSSYHREYLWSQETNKGLCAGLIDFKFFNNQQQADEYTRNDFVETDKAVVKKEWMDTKRKNSKAEITAAAVRIAGEIKEFRPDLIFLGDDNAVNYIGNQFIDTPVPIVFWGVDGLPLKYGLLDSIEHPGHNITGVYQTGYPKESLDALLKLFPQIKTFAVLADDSETARAKTKGVIKLDREAKLPAKLIETVNTNSFLEWQSAASRLAGKVDAFLVVNHNTLKDDQGNYVEPLKVASWYLRTIKKPEAVLEKQFVQEGMLITADDSGFKQAYEAVMIADAILKKGKDPASIPPYAPLRGAIILNRQRAKAFEVDLSDKSFIEEYIDNSLALE